MLIFCIINIITIDNFIDAQKSLEYLLEIRKIIYTTNAIESFNSALRKVKYRKATFPNELAVKKILYLRAQDVATTPL